MHRFAHLSVAFILAGIIALGSALAPRIGASAAGPAFMKTAPAQILVNAQGMTLYVFSVDKPNKSACNGKCATFWPPLVVATGMKAPATMPGMTGKFGVTMRADGKQQLTYDGAPLYTFIKDKKPGDMTGQGVAGTWWTVVVGSGSSSATTVSTSALVKTASAKMLVTEAGLPLYVFAADKPNKSACTGKCATFWPPLLIPAGTALPITVPGAHGKFSATMRPDGTQQCSYDTAPLYTFIKDKKAGDIAGQGVAGTWWVVTA